MIRNYLLVALRIIRRKPVINSINILGLAVSMTVSLLIFQFVAYHHSYDNIPDHENIYRIGTRNIISGHDRRNPAVYNETTIGHEIKDDFPQVREVTMFQPGIFYNQFGGGNLAKEIWLNTGDERSKIKTSSYIYADSSFFRVFQYPLVQTMTSNPLGQLHSAVLSTSLARQLFNTIDVIGEEITVNDNLSLVVTGIYEKPKQVSVAYDLIISGDNHKFWSSQLFLLLDEVNIEQFQALVNVRSEHYWALGYRESKESTLLEAFFQPLDDVHQRQYEWDGLTSVTYSKGVFLFFIVVGLVIMGIAWINTLNLSLSQNIRRIKEVHIRTVIGAGRRPLFVQSMFEFFLSSCMALLIALSLSQVLYPTLIANGLDFSPTPLLSTPLFWAAILFSMVSIAAFSAWLQQRIANRGGSIFGKSSQRILAESTRLRKLQHALIVTQFMCTTGLLIAITVISMQIDFILGQELGFNPEQVIVIPSPYHESDQDPVKMDRFLAQVGAIHGMSATRSLTYPGHHAFNIGYIYQPGQPAPYNAHSNGMVSENFVEFFEIDLLAGTSFQEHQGESNTMLISRRLAEILNYESIDDALNQPLIWHHYAMRDSSRHVTFRIIGIYDDYETRPFNRTDENRGSLLFPFPKQPIYGLENSFFSVRMRPGDEQAQINEIERLYRSTFPNSVFEHFRFEDQILSRYANEQLMQTIVGALTILSTIVSALGLFALISLSLAHRVKEIGIRRVLGASFAQLFHGLSFTYLKLILVASVLGAPIVLYYSQDWLNGFSIRIQVTWLMVAVPLIAVVGLVLLILIVQVRKSVSTNPVQSLRYE